MQEDNDNHYPNVCRSLSMNKRHTNLHAKNCQFIVDPHWLSLQTGVIIYDDYEASY